eukprot:403364101
MAISFLTMEQQLKVVLAGFFAFIFFGIFMTGVVFVIYNWTQEIKMFKKLNIQINTVQHSGSLSPNFQAVINHLESKEINDHDFYSYKPQYESLYYELSGEQSLNVGLPEFQSFPGENEPNSYTFIVHVNDTNDSSRSSQINIDSVPIFQSKIHPTRSQLLCNKVFGYFMTSTQHCYLFYRLSEMCVKINRDNQTEKWALNDTFGTYGCQGLNSTVAEYAQIKVSENKTINNYFPMSVAVSTTVRNGMDPFIYAKGLTQNTFNFGISSRDMLVLGIAFMVIGFFTIIQPVVYIYQTRQEVRRVEQLYSQEEAKKRQAKYRKQKDEDQSHTEDEEDIENNQGEDIGPSSLQHQSRFNKQNNQDEIVFNDDIRLENGSQKYENKRMAGDYKQANRSSKNIQIIGNDEEDESSGRLCSQFIDREEQARECQKSQQKKSISLYTNICTSQVPFQPPYLLKCIGFQHSAFVFAQEANMHENKYNHYRIPAGLLITFLEKALTLINMETHLNDNEEMKICQQPFTLLSPHYCDVNVTAKERMQSEIERLLEMESQMTQKLDVRMTQSGPINASTDILMRNNGPSLPDQYTSERQLEGGKRSQAQTYDIIETNGKSAMILNHHQGQVYHTQWNPTKRILVSGGQGKNAFLWSVPAEGLQNVTLLEGLPHCKDVVSSVQGIDTDITCIHWNQSGDKMVTSASDGYARVWSDKGELQSIFNCNNISKQNNSSHYKENANNDQPMADQYITSGIKEDLQSTMVMVSKWSKDGQLIASGTQDRKVLVWMPQGMKQDSIVKTFNQDNEVVDLDWQNSTDIASCSMDQNIYLWSVTQDQPLRVWRGHQSSINAIKWDHAGSLLASCSEEESAYLWSPKQNEAVRILKGHTSSVNNLRWNNHPQQSHGSPQSTSGNFPVPILATASRDQTIKLWDVEIGKCLMTLQGHDSPVLSLAFSPDNKLMVSGGLSDELFIWSLQDQRIIKAFKQTPQMQGGMVLDVNWSFDGNMIAAGNNKSIMLFDLRYLYQMQL